MFDAYVAFHARFKPRAVALITPERWATYAELEDDINRIAAGLRDLGVSSGRGVVSVRMQDQYLLHVTVLALARLAVVSSPAADPAADLRLVDAEQATGPKQLALTPDWVAARMAETPVPVAPVRVSTDTVVRVMLSSGTTKVSRRIAKTWRALEANTRTAALTYLAGKDGRWVSLTGLDSGLGQAMALAAWSIGATLVSGIGAQRLAADIEALHPIIIGATPSHLRTLLRALPPDHAVQPDLRLAVTGAVLSNAVAVETRLRLSSDIRVSYGAAESGSATMADAALLETVAGAAGYPVPGVRVEVVDAKGAVLPHGEQGEIRIFSDRVADGYLGDPEATASCFRDGGFYPGDLGRMMADGLLVVDGRVDDRMNFGGMKFLPNLLEDVALGCLGVVDAACFAVPDAQGIDQCWLAVAAGDGFDREELARRVSQGPGPKVRFAWTEQIPRNENGKIDRHRLRDEAMAALGLSQN